MNGKKKIWTVCVTVLILFCAAGVFYYYYQTSQPYTEKEGTLIMESWPRELWQ